MIITCPECGEKTALKTKICSHCGVKLKQCPKCGNVLKESATACDYCGMESEAMQKSREEKETKKRLSKMQKQAEQYCQSHEKIKKRFSLLCTALEVIAGIFLIVAFIQLVRLENKPETFETLEEELKYLKLCVKIKPQTRTFLTLFTVFLILGSFVSSFTETFSNLILFKKIDTDNFDCQNYYHSFILPIDKAANDKEIEKLISSTTIDFLSLCYEKIDHQAKTRTILIAFTKWILSSLFWLFLVIGLRANAETYIDNVLLYGDMENTFSYIPFLHSFFPLLHSFDNRFIIASVLLIARIALGLFIPDNASKWIKKYLTTK